MSTQYVQNKGIYHALPTFPSNLTGLTAIVTGANGISGHHMVRVLAESPERWSKIYCLSRRPPYIPGGLLPNAVHIAVDFLKTPQEIAQALEENGVKADYVFFFAYIQPAPEPGKGLFSNAKEMTRVNALLMDNFLGALSIAGIKPKRFMLQTGAKHYGMHHGISKVPQEESDPRVEYCESPNFYYAQEDSLFKFCEASNGATGWNVLLPGPILGAVPDAAMNMAFPLAVYAAVTKELGEKLRFPGDAVAFQSICSMSSAMMNAYMEEWAVLTDVAKDQRFNAWDGDVFAWEGFWPRLAAWYGIDWEGPRDDTEYFTREVPYNPRGYGGKGVSRVAFSFVTWAKQSKVQDAWVKLARENDLSQKELVDVERVFGFADGIGGRVGALMMSSAKARKMGWNGFVDTGESMLAVFDDLAQMKMIPPVPKVHVQFL